MDKDTPVPSAGLQEIEEKSSRPQPDFSAHLQQFEYKADLPKQISPQASRAPLTRAQTRRLSRSTWTRSNTRSDSDPIHSSTLTEPRVSKKRRPSSKYAPPSKYAHLPVLQDILEPDLICVFVGTNPGIRTATAGHAYAHPSNLFWKLLHSSGCTDRRCSPEEDVDLPRLYCMGNTNIVERPSKDAAELSKAEMAAGTAKLDEKLLKYKPEAVCIVGKGIWEAIWRYRYGKNPKPGEFRYGWQEETENMGKSKEIVCDHQGRPWNGASVFVTSSTSGLAASLKPAQKEEIWKPFGEWVQRRRRERGFMASE